MQHPISQPVAVPLEPSNQSLKSEDSEVILLRGILLASQLLYPVNPPIGASLLSRVYPPIRAPLGGFLLCSILLASQMLYLPREPSNQSTAWGIFAMWHPVGQPVGVPLEPSNQNRKRRRC